jgi:hypothetical protein
VKFRNVFKGEYQKGFICRANTFDNVEGKFPICFLIWNLENRKLIDSIVCDVLDNNGNINGNKNYYSYNGRKYINEWIANYSIDKGMIGTLFFNCNDFQHQKFTYLSLEKDAKSITSFPINNNNLITGCIYFAVRLCIEPTWLNDRDQFYFPNDGWESDGEFQNNCLVFTLFHGQNRISSQHGVNHWIPFTEREVDAKEKFDSAFMSGFLKGKTFSAEALAVLDAGRELWKYYHAKTKNNRTASVNASFYDIREFFQGRNDKGAMRTKSDDATYNELLAALRNRLRTLTEKIQPKVYEYGFLKE